MASTFGTSTSATPNGKSTFRHRINTPEDRQFLESFTPEQLRAADTIYGCVQQIAGQSPEKPAIVRLEAPSVEKSRETTTYGQLLSRMTQMANCFTAASGSQRTIVATMVPMLNDGLIALWAAQTAGVAVPINPFIEYHALVGLLRTSEATVLVTTPEVAKERGLDDFADLRADVPSLKRVLLIGDDHSEFGLDRVLEGHSNSTIEFALDSDSHRDSMFMPTGGTTGQPKLVRMNQMGQLNVASNVGSLMGPDEDGVVGHGMPNFHCGGTISLGLRTILYGQTLLTLTSVGFRSKWTIDCFWDIARAWKMTSVLATPTTYQALLQRDGGPQGTLLSDVHCGGSVLPEELVRTFHERFGLWLRDNWGMTELHGTITGHYNDGDMPRVGSAGRTLPNTPVKAVIVQDNEFKRECEPREVGNLAIGGATLCPGYLDPAIDEEFFIRSMPDGQRWGNTGDLGYIDEDGFVFVSGRSKDLIIRGGHNIDPRDIEFALSTHPKVQLAAAVGRPDASKGELPVAFVQLKADTDATEQELFEHCRSLVQERAALPVSITILDEIPQTPVGKIAKPSLRHAALESVVREIVDRYLGPEIEFDLAAKQPGSPDAATVLMKLPAEDQCSEPFSRAASELSSIKVALTVAASPVPSIH
ncbi:acyl-CoA synthetase [Citricoccus zhacaiensis]|uniref:Acyl-CoA synthetase n=1 Tax=Citricoccus zhacaiensis TaxID=489142 RepID=A0ABQ2LWH6_9MICC|nr:AMP-binding protein [Citricoccus zhacaiensis]GGO43677.1 acyl-CoA synthetase [Citricoccus zhacaiensis]